jgi:uncharacterized protein YebE (UPF0316 family)
VRGLKHVAPFIGFFEVLVWIFAVGNAIRFLDSPLHLLGYAAGFATGTVVGMWLEERMAFGMATVRIISKYGGVELAEALRDRGFGVTEFSGHGREGRVEFVYAVLRRRDLPQVYHEVDVWDPAAFVTVEEPRAIHRGWMFGLRRK